MAPYFVSKEPLMFDPFHSGEQAIQERTGERGRAIANSRMIANLIPANAHAFVAQQTYYLLGVTLRSGEIWTWFLSGEIGCAQSHATGARLTLNTAGIGQSASADLFFAAVKPGGHVGLLFIEFASRRRLRVNGTVADMSADMLDINVSEAFPNCPKYIQRRAASLSAPGDPTTVPPLAEVARPEALTAPIKAWISQADTFFVASAHPNGPVDVSHRGGNPGFITFDGDRLRIPDYPGNAMFSTLGNFAVNKRAGLVFVDFALNRQLQLTGDVELVFDEGEMAEKTGGTGRWWWFSTRRWIVSPVVPAHSWALAEPSPYNP
jgi:hypothetical protein